MMVSQHVNCLVLLMAWLSTSVFSACNHGCPSVNTGAWFSDLMVCNITFRSTTLRWRSDQNTPNASYIVIYEDNIRNEIRSDPITGSDEILTYEILGLTPLTGYMVEICQPAEDTCGNCNVTFMTPEVTEPSGPPANLMILASGPFTLIVSWDAPLLYREVVMSYTVRCAPQNNPQDVTELPEIRTVFEVLLRNLRENTTYDCEVFTRSEYGDSPSARASAMTPPRQTVPGAFFVVAQNQIGYKEISGSTLNTFFSFFDDPIPCLLNVPANITGVDYHFQRQELYLSLVNGSILQYSNLSNDDTDGISVNINLLPTVIYTTMENQLGAVAVDWVFNNVYWIEFQGSDTKLNRWDIDSGQVVCEVLWQSQLIEKISVDPIHGYFYWSVNGSGLYRSLLKYFRDSQDSDCSFNVPEQNAIFSSPTLVDFVLEPEVFIYIISDGSVKYIGFDTNSSEILMSTMGTLVESFGLMTVTITGNSAKRCDVGGPCPSTVVMYGKSDTIDDVLVFRESKQPLPVPPSFPADVQAFSGSESVVISWQIPSFAQTVFSSSAFDEWKYCVNYKFLNNTNMQSVCTCGLNITLMSLESDTFYTFSVTAVGPGGNKTTPVSYLFKTKQSGADAGRLLISTDDSVVVTNLDGSNSVHVSDNPEIRLKTQESNGVSYDFRSSLYFWIVEGGQGPLVRYDFNSDTSDNLEQRLDTPISLAADWIGRRVFWVQDGNNVADDRQLRSISMDGGNFDIFTEDSRITSIAVDSLNGRIFWTTGKDIETRLLNGVVLNSEICISVESEPLALTLDVERKHLYWMTFNNDDNTVWLNQLSYSVEECSTRVYNMSLPGSLFVSSRRGVLTYGLGSLYLTTISSGSQAVYVLPSDFASFSSVVGNDVDIAVGIIQQTDVVRDIAVVSDILQPLPDGLVAPGLTNVMVGPLSDAPKLRTNESSTEVIVIEWGKSTNAQSPILYQVEYALTAFLQTTTIYGTEFTTSTFIRLEDQTPYTEVNVTVTPHSLWVKSDDSLTVRSIFFSTPNEPGKVMNVRAYVYQPDPNNQRSITALIVWDPLNGVEAGGIVSNYSVTISGGISKTFYTRENESYFIVRDFITNDPFNNILYYPLDKDMTYSVQVSAVNDGGVGELSDSVSFSTNSISLPQDILVTTSDSSFLYGNFGKGDVYTAVDPLCVNTISRLVYWYNSSMNSIMVQSLDGDTISVFLYNSPISISTMSYEWQGERLYMAGYNSTTNQYELWRVPVMLTQDIEIVYQLSEGVQSVSNLVIDSFRRGRAFWLQMMNGEVLLENLQFKRNDFPERMRVEFPNITVSALTLDPSTGELWVSDNSTGKIFRCTSFNNSCIEVLDTGINVRSISLDENKLSFTNGSVIYSVVRENPSIVLNSSTAVFQSSVISLHTLSPGQQPLYYKCRDAQTTSTCLAPDLIFDPFTDIAPTETFRTVTNTTIELEWSLPSVKECCYDEIFTFPLVQYVYGLNQVDPPMSDLEEPFQRRLQIDGLQPFDSYNIFLGFCNQYTIFLNQLPCSFATLWIQSIRTSEGVPDGVSDLTSTGYGVTCINVSWDGLNDDQIRGKPDNLRYFITYYSSGTKESTIDVDNNTSVVLQDVTPGADYTIEVRASNWVFNSSVAKVDDARSLPLVPTPDVFNMTRSSFDVVLKLEPIHSNISSVYIEATTAVGERHITENVFIGDSPVNLTFQLTNLSAFTIYSVTAVATYPSNECRNTKSAGNSTEIRTEADVPDTPSLSISADGEATWEPVNPRTDGRLTYTIRVYTLPEGELVTETQVDVTSYDLDQLNLRVKRSYNVCVNAQNNIGNSSKSCETFSPGTSSSGLSSGAYAGIGVGVAFLLAIPVIIICVIVCFICKRREQKSLARLAYAYGPDLELSNIRAQRYHRTNAGSNNINTWSRETFVATEEELALLNQFSRQHIRLENFLGQGEFGEVYQGTAFDILGADTGPHPVAIKTFRKGATIDEKHKFLSEAALMGKFNHPNIVNILGICVDNDPVFLIMELMPAGDLLKFLREARPESGPALLTREEQLLITKDISQGCRYLEQQHFIHRDLAARNCLVSSKGADRVVKIGDFGLARDLYSSDYYRVEGERKLPVRWMAPEALLQGKFTIESDVWAYGVLLYEVMSFGNQPYPGQSNQDVLQFVTAGGRLQKPENCPQRIYRLMMMCWRKYASERPRFEEICQYLDDIIEDMRRESYCESDSDEGETLSRDGSKRFPTRSPSIKGFQNLVRSGSKKLRNSLRRHSMHRKEDQTTHTSVSSCSNLIPAENGDTFRESGLI